MDLVFFSFIRLEEGSAEDHRAYNRWHQLDHRPENLALPGVAWGDRPVPIDPLRRLQVATDLAVPGRVAGIVDRVGLTPPHRHPQHPPRRCPLQGGPTSR
ncbi:hypothetical protein I601_0209 [Nocardioides dokdonensis FR1436]|uniref:Uncharacterized protein n=1 Tax=Nocardioides dokdonensis FR1436 TaxID=1300347 RepID=A0A1A9GGB7_9ACTN|nr:hypothetical protein [Nocardioides dokdonensis]ANH36663.1 hypothetical protein I601_0209 [Nocardioides dokdonensis FR1436]